MNPKLKTTISLCGAAVFAALFLFSSMMLAIQYTDKKQSAEYFKPEYLEDDDLDDEEIQIIRSKKFAVKPMDPEEACIQMELLGHSFFVFRNSETDDVNVVYKRKGNTYGLIEPEF